MSKKLFSSVGAIHKKIIVIGIITVTLILLILGLLSEYAKSKNLTLFGAGEGSHPAGGYIPVIKR